MSNLLIRLSVGVIFYNDYFDGRHTANLLAYLNEARIISYKLGYCVGEAVQDF
ncbi:MAG TPA: hypothetical protein PKD17_04480 [Cellvibrionaceae bacterium]|nr:hypothetical protein [Cellvibrionaceae bacterium]HNG58389.1 hypothetical protein [Cellvibrionaceae bacterium]